MKSKVQCRKEAQIPIGGLVEQRRGKAMNKDDFLTLNEVNALLTTEEAAPQTVEEAIKANEEMQAAEERSSDHSVVAELQQALLSLTSRVEALEQKLLDQGAEAERAILLASMPDADSPNPEETISVSRSELYGRSRKKKRSFWKRLKD
jgi:hypothetical protein